MYVICIAFKLEKRSRLYKPQRRELTTWVGCNSLQFGSSA